MKRPCPTPLPVPVNDSGPALLDAWMKAAKQYHNCKDRQRDLSEAIATYEAAVLDAYCKALRERGERADDCPAD